MLGLVWFSMGLLWISGISSQINETMLLLYCILTCYRSLINLHLSYIITTLVIWGFFLTQPIKP